MIADEVWQQLLKGLPIQRPFDANVAAIHLDMAVVLMVVIVIVVAVVMRVGRGLVVQAQDNSCLHLSLRHR